MSKRLAKLLAVHSSPAICGLKASNLINIEYSESICSEIDLLNEKYNPKIYFRILKRTRNNVLILVYKNDVLKNHLYKEEVRDYLFNKGYISNDLEYVIKEIQNRIDSDSFPHEIGVLLGYDLNDIKSFELGDKECIYVGYWKVYSNLEEKINLFNRFTKCKDCVVKLVDKGYPLENFLR